MYCSALLKSYPFFASVLVTLVHHESVVGEGTVCSRRESVYGHTLTPDEVTVCVSSVFVDQLVHPSYEYAVEEGGFTTWRREDCRATQR